MRRATTKANLAEEPEPSPHSVITLSDPLKLQALKVPEGVDFRELPDGTLLETIADPQEAGKNALVVFENGEIRVAPEFEFGDRILRPLPTSLPGIRHINFANGAEML